MPEVTIKVGMNHAQVKTGAAEVKSQLDAMKKHGESAMHGAHGGHGGGHQFGALVGEMKAERNIARLGQDLANATTGSEMLAVGLERVGRILHLGIGLGVAAHLAGYFIEKNNKLNETFEKLHESAEAFGESSKTAMESGSFDNQLASLTQGVKLMKEMTDTRKKAQGVGSFLGALFSGDMFTGATSERNRTAANDRRETAEHQKELAHAAVEEVQFTAEIAEMKALGHDREASALERERKLKQDIAKVERSALGHEDKEAAIEALRAAHESADSAQELADAREAQLAVQKEMNDLDAEESKLMGEMRRMGESDEQRMTHLVNETGNLVKQNTFLEELESKGRLNEQGRLDLMKQRVQVVKNMKDIAEVATKQNAKTESEAAARQERIWAKQQSNADKQFKNSLDGMTEEQKIGALLQKRSDAAKEFRAAMKTGNEEAAEDAKGKVLDLNREIDQLARNAVKAKPAAVASDLTRKGLGGAVFFAKDQDPAKRAAKAAEDSLKVAQRAEALLKRIAEKQSAWNP